MKRTGSKAFVILLLMAAFAMSLAVFMSCTVDDEDTQNALPTGLGEGITDFDPPPVNPGMTLDITPDQLTRTLQQGYVYTGGVQTHFYVRGGKAPYAWSHSNANVANISPVDEFSDGVLSELVYTFRTFYAYDAGDTDDTILVTDGDGNVATATVTITVEEAEEAEVPALSIVPQTATVTVPGTITFSASGGVPPYTWADSDGIATLTVAADTLSATLNTVGIVVATTVTVYVTDSASTTVTAAVTVTP